MIEIKPSCDHRHGFEVEGPALAITMILIVVIYLPVLHGIPRLVDWKTWCRNMMFRCLIFHMPLNLQTQSVEWWYSFIRSNSNSGCLQNFYFEIPWIFQVITNNKHTFSRQYIPPSLTWTRTWDYKECSSPALTQLRYSMPDKERQVCFLVRSGLYRDAILSRRRG